MTHADLATHAREQGFAISADEVPADSRPLAALAYEKTGFYFLGVAPVVPVSLRAGVRRLVAKARELGADGLANLRYEYQPASAFRFVVFPIPDWSASLSITGVAYTRAARPGRTTSAERVDTTAAEPVR